MENPGKFKPVFLEILDILENSPVFFRTFFQNLENIYTFPKKPIKNYSFFRTLSPAIRMRPQKTTNGRCSTRLKSPKDFGPKIPKVAKFEFHILLTEDIVSYSECESEHRFKSKPSGGGDKSSARWPSSEAMFPLRPVL